MLLFVFQFMMLHNIVSFKLRPRFSFQSSVYNWRYVYRLLLCSVLVFYSFVLSVVCSSNCAIGNNFANKRCADRSYTMKIMSSKSLTNSAIKQLTVPASPKFVFVGGKGGVGKTTSSSGATNHCFRVRIKFSLIFDVVCLSAIALQFSDNGFRTLVVSTDPAHSLVTRHKLQIIKSYAVLTENLFYNALN